MMNPLLIHVLSPNSTCRAKLARLVFDAGSHAEIYADVGELVEARPARGVILLELGIGNFTIANLTAEMNRHGFWLSLVAHTAEPTVREAVKSIKAGALNYIMTPETSSEIKDLLAELAPQAAAEAAEKIRAAEAISKLARLSVRERQVLDLLASGHSNKGIARTLDISPRTVEIHRMKMMGKIGARNAAEAVRIRIEVGEDLPEAA